MRLAVLIVGLVIGLVVLLQACSVYGLSSVGEAFGSAEPTQMSGAGAAGILSGLLIMVGAGVVMPFPRAAATILGLAAVIALLIGATSDFSDQFVWGVVAAALAVMAWLGARGKRSEDAVKAQERANLAVAAERARAESTEPTKVCPNCAETVKAAAVQCRFCGYQFEPNPAEPRT